MREPIVLRSYAPASDGDTPSADAAAVITETKRTSALALFAALLFGLPLSLPAAAMTWYVDPSGSDSWPGVTTAQPFRTWQRAVNVALPGDTILLTPGTYAVGGSGCCGVAVTRSGTAGAPITLRGRGGRAVLNCSAMTRADGVVCLQFRSAAYWNVGNIAVTGAKQQTDGAWSQGLYVLGGHDILLDNVTAYRNEGPGIVIEGDAADVTIRNSDSYANYDRRAWPRGANADGFDLRASGPITVMGCRAWSNSDDGFDAYNKWHPTTQPVRLSGNWAFRNGYVPGTTKAAGDGVGFKLGISSAPRVVDHNLAFLNRYTGFDSNGGSGAFILTRNTSYKNGKQEFAMDAYGIVLTENIAYGRTDWLNVANNANGNSWQLGHVITDADFQSVDPSGTDGLRQSDGSLPVLPFLRPQRRGHLGVAEDAGPFAEGEVGARMAGGRPRAPRARSSGRSAR